MIESVIPMDLPLLDQSHRPEVFLFSGLVRQPGISSRDLNARVTKQRLQTLEPHSGIQEFTGECVPKTMQRVAFMKKIRFLQVSDEHRPCRGIGDALIFLSI